MSIPPSGTSRPTSTKIRCSLDRWASRCCSNSYSSRCSISGWARKPGPSARFEPVALHEPITWRYRGQIVPTNKQITAQVEITRIERDDDGILAVADASLWIDGKRIYSATNLGMRITRASTVTRSSKPLGHDGDSGSTFDRSGCHDLETTIDPAQDIWIADHCPTYVIPSLPMMSVLDLFAQAASRAAAAAKVVEISDLRLLRWIVVDSPTRLRVIVEPAGPGRFEGRLEVWRDAPRSELSRWETHAQAMIVTADDYAGEPAAPAPLKDAVPLCQPVRRHGVPRARVRNPDGRRPDRPQRFVRDACGRAVQGPGGPATSRPPRRCAAHRSAHRDERMDHGQCGCRVVCRTPRTRLSDFRGASFGRGSTATPPVEGTVDVETRFVGFDDAPTLVRMPIVDLWLSVAGKPWAYHPPCRNPAGQRTSRSGQRPQAARIRGRAARGARDVVERSARPRGGHARFRARGDARIGSKAP